MNLSVPSSKMFFPYSSDRTPKGYGSSEYLIYHVNWKIEKSNTYFMNEWYTLSQEHYKHWKGKA